MTEIIDGKTFLFQIASDVRRNGISVEMYKVSNDATIFLTEVFRNDAKQRVEFSTRDITIPLRALQRLIQIFEKEIPATFDT